MCQSKIIEADIVAQPWDKQENETSKAFAAFSTYLSLGSDRSILSAYRHHKDGKRVKRVPGHWQRWASQNTWQQRAAAYDSHLVRLQQRALEEKLLAEQAAALEKFRSAHKNVGIGGFNSVLMIRQLLEDFLRDCLQNGKITTLEDAELLSRISARLETSSSESWAMAIGVSQYLALSEASQPD